MSALPPFLIKLQQQLKEKQTRQSAQGIINEYLSFFTEDSINKELWMLTVGALTNDVMEVEKASDRNDIIFFYEYTKMFYEAIFLLYNKRKRSKKSTHKSSLK
jgi:hypothetical protein